MVGHTRPKFGRYHVQRLIGVGMTGPVFGAEDAETRAYVAIKAPRIDLSPDVTLQLVDDLKIVVERLPAHPAIVPLLSAGLEDRQPYLVSEFAPGERLDRTLQRDGPGAIADLLPRLQAVAEALDLAAKHGLFHGALHPADVMVSPDSTVVTGIGFSDVIAKRESRFPIHPPYSAPEVEMGADPSNASDQFSLAAIAFEWLFGPGLPDQPNSPLEVPDLPGVDCDVLADAFTIAWSSSPLARFSSCRSFVDAIAASVHRPAEPELPKLVARTPVEADTRAAVSAFTIVQLQPFTNERPAEPVSSAHMGLMTSAQVEAEPPTPDVDDAGPEDGMVPEDSSHADLPPINVPQLSHAAETLLAWGLETPIPMSTPRVIDPRGFAETARERVAEPPILTAITPLIAQSPQMEMPIASGPVAETPFASVPENYFPPATPLVTEESALTGTPRSSVPETPLPLATLNEAPPTPFVETPIASPVETAIAPATALVSERWALAETPLAPKSEASLPSATLSEIAPSSEIVPFALAETPLASVSETPLPPAALNEAAPTPFAETPIASVSETPIPSARLSAIARSALAQTPVSIRETPVPSSRGSIPSTSEFESVRVFAFATDGGRGFLLALAATLILGIAVGFAGGFAAASRRPSQVTAAQVPVERTAEVSPREPVTSAQKVETAARVPAAAGAAAAKTAALKVADTKKVAREAPPLVQTRSSAPVKPSRSVGPGSLVIESQPPGAAVTVNGMARGKTPLTIGALPAGTYTVAMALQKFQPVSTTVTVIAGERSRAALTLRSANRQQ